MTWTTRQRSNIGGQPAVVAGAGVPVVMLHGVGLRAEAWGAQISGLANQALIVVPDMPGHGENALLKSNMQFADYVEAAEAVLAALDGPAVVVGHSMGAMIALVLAAQHPARVRSVVALNAVFERSPAAATAVMDRAQALDGTSQVDPTTTLVRWFGDALSPERDACRDWLCAVEPAAYKQCYTAFAQSQTPDRDLLSRLACPAIFITGSAEPNSTPAMSRAMAQITPKGRAVIVEGAAHMMPMTHPDQVNAVVAELIKTPTERT